MQSQTKGGMGSFGGFVREAANREINGARNAIPGTRNFNWRQTLDAALLPGNWYDSQGGGWQIPGSNMARDLFGRSQQGESLPAWMNPGGGPAPQGPSWEQGLPNYSPDQTYAGPPPSNPYYGNGQGMFPMPQPQRPSGPGVRGGHVIAQGQDAQNMVEGMRGPMRQPGNDWLRMMQQYATIR